MRLAQCKGCPWRKDVNPLDDIPNGYCPEKHAALESTISKAGELQVGSLQLMACHECPVGQEQACVGWMHNQLGSGNNIGLRMWFSRQVRAGKITGPLKVVGEQHECFEDTLPDRP